MMIGDVVLIQDSKELKGHWKLGKISKIHPGKDGKVRRVTVQYVNPNHNSFTYIERPVQRLVVVVAVDEFT